MGENKLSDFVRRSIDLCIWLKISGEFWITAVSLGKSRELENEPPKQWSRTLFFNIPIIILR